eukprot:GFUD01061168.1.p1 GENE.GFUD01061168.1~~GFUD01061168.1.p1  ORF type:complete len:281 (+),score=3.96 GFUD01061168.1:84-926(+)
MAALLSIFFLTLVLSTHHAVGGKREDQLCSKYEGGVEKYCPKKESGPKLPWPCPWNNWNCEGDIIQTLYDVTSWEDCGRACDTYHVDGCEYWTYTYYSPVIDPVCNLQSSCPGRRSDDSISGAWNCPQSTVQAESKGLCSSCGSCPCCIGACIWGVCLPLIGGCIPTAKTGASVEEACLYQASSLITNECSGNCSVGGEPACQTCIEDNGAETCATTSSIPRKCWPCIISVVAAYRSCRKLGSPRLILTCIIEKMNSKLCISCACKLACKHYHPICQYCK